MRLAFVLLLLWAAPVEAATYYVRTDGANGPTCNGTVNVADSAPVRPNCAWATPDYASDNVTAGDTIRVQTGHYGQTVSPTDSGTLGNPITMVADGSVTVCSFLFANVSYIRIVGVGVNGTLSGCTLTGSRVGFSAANTGLEFWNMTITEGNFGFNMGVNACTSCIIIGGTITGINNGGYGIVTTGNDAFVGYVGMSDIDYIGVAHAGLRGRFVNLSFSGFLQIGIRHPDFFFPQGSTFNTIGYSNNLIESIYGIGTPNSNDNKVMHFSNGTGIDFDDNTWRQSVFYDMGSGMFSVYAHTADNNRFHFYNNTIVECARALSGNGGCGNFETNGNVISATIKNHLFYQAWSDDKTTDIRVWSESESPVMTKDYNLAFSPGGSVSFNAQWSAQSNEQSNVDPLFVNAASDWTLQAGSGARGVGGPLTTASTGGASSTTLSVAAGTGGMFVGSNASNLPQYSGALVPGDFITVDTATVQVASVSGDTLTLATPISWDNGDPIYYGTSATIDVGAYPYKAGGYTLSATYTPGSGAKVITPNDASLVRFVVCYSDSVPYEIDNTSPYTCSAPSGTFSARAYPRYASATLFAEATELTGGVRLRFKGPE